MIIAQITVLTVSVQTSLLVEHGLARATTIGRGDHTGSPIPDPVTFRAFTDTMTYAPISHSAAFAHRMGLLLVRACCTG